MPKAPSSFTQTEILRAVRGAVKAGLAVRRVEIDRDGKIVLVAGAPTTSESAGPANPWDEIK